MPQCAIAGGRTKGANKKSFVFVHQHGGNDVRWKLPVTDIQDNDVARNAFMIQRIITQIKETKLLSLPCNLPLGYFWFSAIYSLNLWTTVSDKGRLSELASWTGSFQMQCICAAELRVVSGQTDFVLCKFINHSWEKTKEIRRNKRGYIKHSKECFITYPNTVKLGEKTRCARVFFN